MVSSPVLRNLRKSAVIGLTISGWWAAPALAAGPMATGGLTSQPIGHYDFCKTHRSECSIRPTNLAPATMTAALLRQLVSVTTAVNAAVKPMSDLEIYGKDEVWAYPDSGVGDCEDYVLEKRRRLMALGVPAGDLMITVVRQANGDGHAVLTVRTSNGEYILDNLEPRVLAWADTDYTYLKRQSERNSGVWVQINDGRADAVASVR
jgi:predicted transglutaminase-like cysteine proteinase